MKHFLDDLFHPRSIVIAGASNNLNKIGAIQTFNLLNSGYKGDVVFIHPKEKTILGRPAYASPQDIPFTPDLAFLVTPAKITIDLLDKLGEKGVRSAVIVTAGFREMGAKGLELEQNLLQVAQKHGIRFVGPNCIGIVNTAIDMNLTFFAYANGPGKLGLISQSGTYVTQTMAHLRERGIAYSKAISVGNSTDIDLVDSLEYLGQDPETHAVALYIEGIKNGRKFIETARKVVRNKPVIALYIGGSKAGSRAAASHTASIGGPDLLYQGMFEQAGIIRANSLDELFGWGHALANQPAPKGRHMAALTHSGGPGSSFADTCEKNGLEVPEFSPELQDKIGAYLAPMASAKNPVDLTFSLEHEILTRKVPELFFESDEVDGVFIHGIMDTGLHNEMYRRLPGYDATPDATIPAPMDFDMQPLLDMHRESKKPLLASTLIRDNKATLTLSKNGVPVYHTPEEAALAMVALYKSGVYRERMNNLPDFENHAMKDNTNKRSGFRRILDEHESKRILAQYGVPIARELKACSLEDALSHASDIGFPVVMKGIPQGVAHKSEAGLVHVGIKDEQALKIAWNKIEQAAPGCVRLVAEMLKGKRELLVGMNRYASFGPAVLLGMGGIFTEALADATLRVAPVTPAEAELMPDSLRLKKLFEPQRGLPEIDRKALAKIIAGVSRLAIERPEIAEIDINPLIIVDGKPVAVDALVVIEE